MDAGIVMAVAALAAAGAAIVPARRALRVRRNERGRNAELLRLNRKVADEDVTRFGEELVELHVDTLTTELDSSMREHYQHALDAYEDAKADLAAASVPDHVTQVAKRLEDGRYSYACVLARRDDRPLPERRPPCFFDPAHGPATRDVLWAPPLGTEREIPVCFRDAERLVAGEAPDVRLVRLGNRRVPWYAAGPAYQPWASGWYDRMLHTGQVTTLQLTMMFAAGATMAGAGGPDVGAWSDPGGWSPTDMGTPDSGHDFGGGFDGAGFDGGGGGGDF